MKQTSSAGVLVGSAVLFVILWETRSALGMLLRYDTNVVSYMLATMVIVGLIAIGLNIGLIGREEPANDEST